MIQLFTINNKGGILLNRGEILARNKNSSNVDEGEQFIEDKSRNIGEIGMILFFIVIFVYKKWSGIPAEDLMGLFWGYLGFTYIGKLKYYKTKKHLVSTILSLVATFAFIALYILKTW